MAWGHTRLLYKGSDIGLEVRTQGGKKAESSQNEKQSLQMEENPSQWQCSAM